MSDDFRGMVASAEINWENCY